MKLAPKFFILAIGIVIAISFASCSQTHKETQFPTADSNLSLPLSTSINTSQGTWAVFPMGDLSNHFNRFWQLFYQPPNSSSWTNLVKEVATATNGGLSITSNSTQTVVAIRPSFYLQFTPIISTRDQGSTWSNGLLDHKLATYPNSLALGSNNEALAVVDAPGGNQVYASTRNLDTWKFSIDLKKLKQLRGSRLCQPTKITAVSYLGDTGIIGVDCSTPGMFGLYRYNGSAWQFSGGHLPSDLSNFRISVVGIDTVRSGAEVLLDNRSRNQVTLAVASIESSQNFAYSMKWTTSHILSINGKARLICLSPISNGGFYVLDSTRSGGTTLYQFSMPNSTLTKGIAPLGTWTVLSSPPIGTQDVVSGSNSLPLAMQVNKTSLSIWSLNQTTRKWDLSQSSHVSIQFGSSNP